MSKSIEFCVAAAIDPDRSGYANRNWPEAYEYDSMSVFDAVVHGERELQVTGRDEDGNRVEYNVNLIFSPDADFQYFTSESCVHDGTLLFVGTLLEKCVEKVCCLGTYYAPLGEPHSGTTVAIEIGNFVILNEFDEDGVIFAPEDKKWMRQRTTVLLPLRMEYS